MPDAKRIPYPNFCGPAYNCTARQAALGVDRAINFYLQSNQVGSAKDQPHDMPNRPGLVTFANPGTGVGRGLFVLNMTISAVVVPDQICGVAGTKFFTMNPSSGAITIRGDVNGGTFPCQAFANIQGTQVAILNIFSTELYVWNGTTVALVAAQPAPFYSIAYLDGFLYGVANGNIVYQSGLNDFTAWDVLDFASREDAADFVVSLFSQDDALMLPGQETTSFWGNSGAAGFALARIPGSFIRNGTGSPFSIVAADAKGDTVTAMVSKSTRGFGQVMVVQQGSMTPFSTYAIELILQRATSIFDIIGSSFQMEGHSFLTLTSPTGFGAGNPPQLAYDFIEKGWYEWGSGADGTSEMPAFYISVPIVTGIGTGTGRLFGMRQSDGRILRLDPTLRTDEGGTFLCRRVGPVMYHTASRFTIFELQVDVQIGTGLTTTGAGLKLSYNGGLTYDAAYDSVLAQEDGSIEWRNRGQADQRGFSADIVFPSGGLLTVSGLQLEITEDDP